MEKEIEGLQENLKTREQALLFQANHNPDDVLFVHRSVENRNMTWNDVIELVYKRQLYAYEKHLAMPEKASQIEAGVYSYLAIRSRLYQMQRVQKALASEVQDPQDGESLRLLNEQLSAVRGYNGKEPLDRLFLFYEAASPKGLFKPEQVLKIRELGLQKVALAEMPTGYGKTDYVIPMLNEWMRSAEAKGKAPKEKRVFVQRSAAKLKRLILNVWPGPLVSVNSQAIRQKIGLAKGGKTFEMRFTREMGFNVMQLEMLLVNLEDASDKGIPISVRAEDLAAIHLHFFETLERFHLLKIEEGDQERLALFRGILRIVHGQAKGSIDESQDVLDPMKRTIYTVGSPKECPKVALEFAGAFYDLLEQNAAFKEVIGLGRNLTPPEADEYVKKIFDDATLARAAQMVEMPLDQLKKFLHGEIELPAGLKNPQKAYLLKGYYFGIVKATISGAIDLQYGLSKVHHDRFKFAIPYEKKDLPQESKDSDSPSVYSNIDETLFKTLRIYHAKGLNKEDLVHLFGKMIEQFIDYPTLELTNSIEDFKIRFNISKEDYQAMLETIPGDPSSRIRAALPKDLDPIKESKWINHFMKFSVAPGLFVHPSSVWFTPQDMTLALQESISLSATPQATRAHSLVTEFKEMKGSEGKLYDLLMTKINKVEPFPEKEAFLDRLDLACRQDKVCAVADPSGMMRFDQAFVKKLAQKFGNDHPIRYIVYFNTEADQFMRYSLESDTDQPFEARAHEEALDHTLTLYDMARSTGSDILQRQDGVEILLTSPPTTIIQAGQGAGRMRKLDKGQSLIVWNAGQQMPKLDLVKLWKSNSEEVSGPKNLAAVQQLMAAEVRIAMIRSLIGLPIKGNEGADQREALKVQAFNLGLYEKYRGHLVRDQDYDPEVMYGGLGKMEKTEDAIKKVQLKLQKEVKQLFKSKEAKEIAQSLEGYTEVLKELKLPQEVPGVHLGEAQEMQQEMQQELEQEQELQVEKHPPVYDWGKQKEWPSFKEFQKYRFEKDQKVVKIFQEFKELGEKIAQLKVEDKDAHAKKIGRLQRSRVRLIEKMESNQRDEVKFQKVNHLLNYGLPPLLVPLARIFDDRFLVSDNLIRSVGAVELALINAQVKMPLHRLLFVYEKGQLIQSIAINVEDEAAIKQQINDSYKEVGAKRQMALYDLATDSILDKTQAFPELADKDSVPLVAQAKLLAGLMNYTPEQKKFLTNEAEKIDPKKGLSLLGKFLYAVTPIKIRKPRVEYDRIFGRPIK
jgi:hypothetical protein